MKITVRMDRIGNLHVDPADPANKALATDYLREWGHNCTENDSVVLIQDYQNICDFYSNAQLTRGQIEDIENGYTAEIEMDNYVFGHHIGYDAHEHINFK